MTPLCSTVAGSLFCYIGSLVALGFMYDYYAPQASCGANIAFITITIIGASSCLAMLHDRLHDHCCCSAGPRLSAAAV